MLNKSSRSGQALVELLPSMVLFLAVIGAGLSYFRIMRAATIRQEVVRNLAFAKINNSGTITTPLNQGATITLQGEGTVVPANNNDPILAGAGCFTVSPQKVQEKLEIPGRIFGLGVLAPVEVTTYAVVYRIPNAQCP